MKKQTLWVMKTKCRACGKVHKVKGLRVDLNKLMDNVMARCANGEKIPVIDINL